MGPVSDQGQASGAETGGADGLAVGEPEVIAWVRWAREGSAPAFAHLYDTFFDQVYTYVYHRTGHRQTAEDLVSDVFVRALRGISAFRWRGVGFGAWLVTIARNLVNDHYKSARFRLEASVHEVFDRPASHEGGPEHAAVTGDLRTHVHAALADLTDEQGEVLHLRFLQQFDVAETAAVMGKSGDAVKALQYRALRALAKRVPEELVLP